MAAPAKIIERTKWPKARIYSSADEPQIQWLKMQQNNSLSFTRSSACIQQRTPI
jgi:hypothetical protein